MGVFLQGLSGTPVSHDFRSRYDEKTKTLLLPGHAAFLQPEVAQSLESQDGSGQQGGCLREGAPLLTTPSVQDPGQGRVRKTIKQIRIQTPPRDSTKRSGERVG